MKKLYRFIKPVMMMVIFGMLLKLISTVADIALPYLLSNMIDIGIVKGDIPYITKLCIIMLAIAISSVISGIISHYFAATASQKAAQNIRDRLYVHLQGLPQKTIDKYSSASLTTRVTSDVERVQSFISSTMRMLVRVSFLTVGGIAMTLFIDPFLTLTLSGSMIIIFIISSMVYKLTNPIYRKVQDGIDKLSNIVREGLSGIKTIKAFDKYEHENDRFKDKCEYVREKEIKAGTITAVLSPSITVISNIGLAAVLLVSGLRVNDGFLEVGQIVAIVSYINMILNAMVSVPRIFLMYSRASASAIRINELFEEITEDRSSVNEMISQNNSENIAEFKNVNFTYSGNKNLTLSDISFAIKENTTTAIVGTTGCGKTTLIGLLSGLYSPDSGNVTLFSRSLSSYTPNELSETVGVALQQYNIFSMSIAKNITLNLPYDEEKCKIAAERAQLNDFIYSLENGIDTHISQSGANLSGGQKQRLNLARIFYRSQQLVILDDVTSALDFKTDFMIRKELKKQSSAKAIVIVAQRIASIKDSDNIIVLENGKISGQGKHEELLLNCKEYQKLFNSQQSEEDKID